MPIVSFPVQKLLSLIGFHLFIFACVLFALGDRAKEILLQYMSKNMLPMFSFKSFLVSGYIFRCLMHLEFFFGTWCKKCSNFIILHIAAKFSQHHLLKRVSFSIVYSCLLCHWLISMWIYFRVPLSCYIMCAFVPVPNCSDYCSFVV